MPPIHHCGCAINRLGSQALARISLALSLFTAAGFSVGAQNASLAWAKRAGGSNIDDGLDLAVDPAGNIFVTGHFRLTATFGVGEPNPTLLTALGQDVFIAKYSPGGGLLWVRQARAQAGWGTSVGADGDGNCYVFGYFGPTITFASGQPEAVTFNALANDLFLAKYDREGNFIWAQQAGGFNSEYSHGIAVDDDGNCYVTGRYGSNPANFGAGQPTATALAGIGGNNGEDIFVAKYNSDGLLQWAKSAGGRTGNRGAGIDIDAAGNSYVVGRYTTTSTFGIGEDNETTLAAPFGGNDEIFVAKFGPAGNFAWVRSGLGMGEHDQGTAIAVDVLGNSYATGNYRSIAPFGGQLNQTQLDGGGSDDIFVVKHDPEGNQQWVKMVVGPGSEFAGGIAVDAGGNAYLTGYGFTLTFGAGEANEETLYGVGQNDLFVAKFASDGLLQWVRFDGGTGDDRGQAIELDPEGAIQVGGRFGQRAVFGSGQENETAITSAGGTDVFLAKFREQSSGESIAWGGYELPPNGNPRFTFSGAALTTYTIRRAPTLTVGAWNNIGSVVTDAEGRGDFEDADVGLEFPAFYQVIGD